MPMSKKDFIALADELRAERPQPHWDGNKMTQWELDIEAVARVCAKANPAFNRCRWMDYIAGKCGPNGGAVKVSPRVSTSTSSSPSVSVGEGVSHG